MKKFNYKLPKPEDVIDRIYNYEINTSYKTIHKTIVDLRNSNFCRAARFTLMIDQIYQRTDPLIEQIEWASAAFDQKGFIINTLYHDYLTNLQYILIELWLQPEDKLAFDLMWTKCDYEKNK